MNRVFVYGTPKRGQRNDHFMRDEFSRAGWF